MKSCLIFSCLLAASSIAASAQTNFTPVNIGSVNVGSQITIEVPVTLNIPPYVPYWSWKVNSVGDTVNEFSQGAGTCVPSTPEITCTIGVVFSPKHAGTRFGSIIVHDNLNNLLFYQLIQGTANGPESSFSPGLEFSLGVLPNPTNITVGQKSTVYVTTNPSSQSGSAPIGTLYAISANSETTYGSPTPYSYLTGPNVFTDQLGNGYISDPHYDPYLYSLEDYSIPFLKVPKPAKLAADLSRSLFITKPGGNTVYKEQALGTDTRSQNFGSFSETTFATGSNVWTDWFGNVFVLNNGDLFKYMLQLDGTYVQTKVLQSLSSNLTIDGYGNIYGSIDGGTTLYKEILQPNAAYVLTSEIPVGVANPAHLTIDDDGNIFYDKLVQDVPAQGIQYRSIVKEDFSQAPSLSFATTALSSTSTDSGRVVTITNHGNLPLQFSNVIFPADFRETAGVTGECAAGTSLLADESCTITIDFHPVTPLSASNASVTRSQVVKVITNTLNNPSSEQDIAVSGTTTLGPAATPTFSAAAGRYNNTQYITISDATPGAKIYYTLNGTTPTTLSNRYTGPVAIRNSMTLKAIAIVTGATQSSVASASYSLVVADPAVSLAGGTYTGPQTVTLTCASINAHIQYTTNGSTPSSNSPFYNGPITVSSSQTLKIRAIATGYASSSVVTNKYIIQ